MKPTSNLSLELTEELLGSWGAEEATAEDIIIPKMLLMHGQSERVLQGEKGQGDLVRSTDWETLAKRNDTVAVIPFTMTKTWRVSEMVDGKPQWRREETYDATKGDLPWDFTENGKPMRRDKALNFYVLPVAEAELPTAFPMKLQFLRTSFKAGKVLADHFAKCKMLNKPPAVLSFEIGSEFVNGDKQKYFVFTAKTGKPTNIVQISACKRWYDLMKTQNHAIKEHEVNDVPAASTDAASTDEF